MAKSPLQQINHDISGGKQTKGTNPLLDDIYKRLKPQEEYYADLNKRRGDRLEAEREMRRALKAAGLVGAAAGGGGGGGGVGDGGKGKNNILKILKGLGLGLAAVTTAITALKLRKVFTPKTPKIIPDITESQKKAQRATSAVDYGKLQASDRRFGGNNKKPVRTIDIRKFSTRGFDPLRLDLEAANQKLTTQNEKLRQNAIRQNRLLQLKEIDGRLKALNNQKIRTAIAVDNAKLQKIITDKLNAEKKLIKKQLIAAQLEAGKLRATVSSNSLFSEPQADRSFVRKLSSSIAPGLNEARLNINDPKLKHLSDADLRRNGFVRTTSGVRELKADGNAGKLVKHDTVLEKIKLNKFKAVSGGGLKSPLSSGSLRIDAAATFKANKTNFNIDKMNDPRMTKGGMARFSGSGSALKGVAAVLDLPFIMADALANKAVQSGSSALRVGGKVLGGISRLLGGSFGIGLMAFIAGGRLADGTITGAATKLMSDMIRAMAGGIDVPTAMTHANNYARMVDQHGVFALGSYADDTGKMQHDLYAALKSMGAPNSTNKERFIEFYKTIYSHLNPGKTLNTRLSATDVGSDFRPTQFFKRLALKDFGENQMLSNHMNRPGHPFNNGGFRSSLSPSGSPTITIPDGSASSGTDGSSGVPSVNIIDSSTKNSNQQFITHGSDGMRTLDNNPRIGMESGQDFQQELGKMAKYY